MNKIKQYFTTFVLIRGFFIASLGSAFIYLNYFGLSSPLLNTLFGIYSLYLLLKSNTKIWFTSGVFFAIFWFWWIAMSFIHYNMLWAIPIVIVVIGTIYGSIFASISWFSNRFIDSKLISLILKAIALLTLSYIHPFSFDWFKPELMFIQSYLGIEKWQFALVLLGIILTIWQKKLYYLLIISLAYSPLPPQQIKKESSTIALITTHISVEDKWNKKLHKVQFKNLFKKIDNAIKQKKSIVVLPESVFAVFINMDRDLVDKLKEKAKHISIVAGGLYWDGTTPRNSTYIFTKDKVMVANKVVLVPFGESNPLPDFLSKWVNKIFYDGAVDYKASKNVVDYKIDGVTYRNAICFEATSEKLYKNRPKNMIVLSNDGWFTPSTEATLQKLLLLYYNKKYKTTIYHSINMSKSYIVKNGKIFKR